VRISGVCLMNSMITSFELTLTIPTAPFTCQWYQGLKRKYLSASANVPRQIFSICLPLLTLTCGATASHRITSNGRWLRGLAESSRFFSANPLVFVPHFDMISVSRPWKGPQQRDHAEREQNQPDHRPEAC
jgi:hypothetical protein